MSKKIAVFFSLFVIWQSLPAHEVKALLGFNSSKYVFSDSTAALEQQRKSGVNFGFGWAYKLGKNMKVEIDAMFSQKGANVTISNTSESVIVGVYKNSSIGIPCFFKYQFMEKRSPYVSFGPEFVFITSHHLVLPETNADYDLSDMTKKFVLAFNAAIGYEYPLKKWTLFAEIRYNNWLGSILKDSQGTVKSESFIFLVGGIYYL
jgi:opacity protein-like surface antigen